MAPRKSPLPPLSGGKTAVRETGKFISNQYMLILLLSVIPDYAVIRGFLTERGRFSGLKAVFSLSGKRIKDIN